MGLPTRVDLLQQNYKHWIGGLDAETDWMDDTKTDRVDLIQKLVGWTWYKN